MVQDDESITDVRSDHGLGIRKEILAMQKTAADRQKAIERFDKQDQQAIDAIVAKVMQAASVAYGEYDPAITPEVIVLRKRQRAIVDARQSVMWFLRNTTPMSYEQIAASVNLANHSTVIHAITAIRNKAEVDPLVGAAMKKMFDMLDVAPPDDMEFNSDPVARTVLSGRKRKRYWFYSDEAQKAMMDCNWPRAVYALSRVIALDPLSKRHKRDLVTALKNMEAKPSAGGTYIKPMNYTPEELREKKLYDKFPGGKFGKR